MPYCPIMHLNISSSKLKNAGLGTPDPLVSKVGSQTTIYLPQYTLWWLPLKVFITSALNSHSAVHGFLFANLCNWCIDQMDVSIALFMVKLTKQFSYPYRKNYKLKKEIMCYD